MNTDAVLMEVRDKIARITLNRPATGNAIDLDMAKCLLAAAGRAANDEAVRCVVLSGAGRMFCAGGDLKLFQSCGADLASLLAQLATTLHAALLCLARMPKPLVVLVNGPAAGAGLGLAVCGDVVIAARSSHFTAAYTAVGLTPDSGVSWQLPRLVGVRRAQEMILTNRRVLSEEAAAIGLVTRTVDDDALEAEGAVVAAGFADSAVLAVADARTLLMASPLFDLEGQLAEEVAAIRKAGGRPESAEGIAAFIERRRARFATE